ncbi:type II toxin-antitoxin system CcdA family antitoxin [Haloflavibacter putidus]|uniref:Uncharacterized protein n=1 Tax=Haloflavibacter putidus TaxID=2576776 RepID=A0A507ZT43_9FLAO|nr:hypothetical protein [Haloflavibacter putidus]TQD38888.1 hypothetical protein FKR84_07865 [Haloflavibacter putidus]
MILQHTGTKYSGNFLLDSLLSSTVTAPTYFPHTSALLELLNAGNLELIQNDVLKKHLATWVSTVETLKDREELITGMDLELNRFIMKHGSWLDTDELIPVENKKGLDFPKFGFQVNNNDLLGMLEFENRVENQIMFYKRLLEIQEPCLELISEILCEIEVSKNIKKA